MFGLGRMLTSGKGFDGGALLANQFADNAGNAHRSSATTSKAFGSLPTLLFKTRTWFPAAKLATAEWMREP